MKDGGPAFPYTGEHAPNEPGMSLRDYFAAAALRALLSAVDTKYHSELNGHIYAPIVYEIADAMLAERDK